MAGGRMANAAGANGPATARDRNLSGANWWSKNQRKYADSTDIGDLAQPFRSYVQDFVDALVKAGATVTVFATQRNPIRTYLMRYSWDVSHHLIAPSKVPHNAGCPIVWDHGDDAKSRAAAQEMASMFRIVYPPPLISRHSEGLAIDMDIFWAGSIAMRNRNGMSFILGAPQSGITNATLHAIGATYGVHKLLSDTLHWSLDGH